MSLWVQHQKSFQFWQHIQLRPAGSLLATEDYCLNKKKKKQAMEGEELTYFKKHLNVLKEAVYKTALPKP